MSKPEVIYSNNCDVYHVTNPETGEYDAKISTYPGHQEIYVGSSSNWEQHTHDHVDTNTGKVTNCHDMESRDWTTKQRD